jgi:hypothetical protein
MSSTNQIEEGKTEREEGVEEEELETKGQPVQETHEESSAPVPDPLSCTLHFTITMLPQNTKESDRQVLLGARTDNDDPLIVLTRATKPADLLPALEALYERLVTELPQRKASTVKRLALASPAPQAQTTAASTPIREAESTPQARSAKMKPTPAPVQEKADVQQGSRRSATKPETEQQTEQMTLF